MHKGRYTKHPNKDHTGWGINQGFRKRRTNTEEKKEEQGQTVLKLQIAIFGIYIYIRYSHLISEKKYIFVSRCSMIIYKTLCLILLINKDDISFIIIFEVKRSLPCCEFKKQSA